MSVDVNSFLCVVLAVSCLAATPRLAAARDGEPAPDKPLVRVGVPPEQPPPGSRPRVIATTDGEIDDRCSMVRFLLYANETNVGEMIRDTPGSERIVQLLLDDKPGPVYRPIWRWAIAFQNDWAARADWCVKGREDANHPPQAHLAQALDRMVRPGARVTLDAARSSDPDGDPLQFRWWQSTDVDTCREMIA